MSMDDLTKRHMEQWAEYYARDMQEYFEVKLAITRWWEQADEQDKEWACDRGGWPGVLEDARREWGD